MDFKKIYDIYGDKLPSMVEFIYDGKHDITLKQIAKYYGARKGWMVWALFIKDFAMFVIKHRAEKAAAEAAAKKVKEDDDSSK